MKKIISIRVKAALLVLVFGFNSIAGFACAIGINRGINKTHQFYEMTNPDLVAADDKNSPHKEVTDKKDDCCNNKEIKISHVDKTVPQVDKLLNPVFFTVFTVFYSNLNISYTAQVNTFRKYFLRGHHPPIPDTRIAIRSFQI